LVPPPHDFVHELQTDQVETRHAFGPGGGVGTVEAVVVLVLVVEVVAKVVVVALVFDVGPRVVVVARVRLVAVDCGVLVALLACEVVAGVEVWVVEAVGRDVMAVVLRRVVEEERDVVVRVAVVVCNELVVVFMLCSVVDVAL